MRGLDVSSNGGDELDPILGWRGSSVGLDFRMESLYFNLHPIERWYKGDVWAQSFAVAKEFTVSPSHTIRPEAQVDWLSKADDFDDGALVLLPSVKHAWSAPFGVEPLTFSHQAWLAWDDGFDRPKNSSDGLFLRYNVGLH